MAACCSLPALLLLPLLLLLALPEPLGAATPANGSAESWTAGSDEPPGAELRRRSTPLSSESLSASQRDLLLLTHTAADSELRETSTSSQEATRLWAEQLASTLDAASTLGAASTLDAASTDTSRWRLRPQTERQPAISPVFSQMLPEDLSLPQFTPDSSLRLGDAASSSPQTDTASSPWQTDAVSSPPQTDAASSPLQTDAASLPSQSDISPLQTDAASSPSQSDTASSPPQTDAASSPLQTEAASLPSQTDASPLQTDAASSPSQSDAASSPSETDTSPSQTDTSPLQTDAASLPSQTDAASSPSQTDAASSPSQTDAASSPSQTDAASSPSQTDALLDGVFSSTTISRAGERTLLSVTSTSNSSSSSAFTEDSNSQQPRSSWSVPGTETEGFTRSATSAGTGGGAITAVFSEASTESLTEPPDASPPHASTSDGTSDSTPPLRATEPSTRRSDLSVSSAPPVTSPGGGAANMSGTYQQDSSVGSSTESLTGVPSSSTQQGTEGTSALAGGAGGSEGGVALTTASPVLSSSTQRDDGVTEMLVPSTDVLISTTASGGTARSEVTESPDASTAARLLPATSPPTTSSSGGGGSTAPTQAAAPHTPPSSTTSILDPHTSVATGPAPSSPSHTPRTPLRTSSPSPPPQLQTSSAAQGVTAPWHGRHDAATTLVSSSPAPPPPPPPPSTESQRTTGTPTTETLVTTAPADVPPTKAAPPRNPCVSNPCLNGGMCVSYRGSRQFTCRCQQAWTGPTCSQDLDECEKDPCPVGSRCVNTRGSFSCECPLGFDLEDGRTCTRAKTFLGTFSVNRHDPVTLKTAAVHEIQREIIQLLNASLSVLRGYSRSTLRKKEEGGVHISAVNMFSISTDVTSAEVFDSIQMSLRNCSASLSHCRMVLHHQLTYHVESLCAAQKLQCDGERSTCSDASGSAHCRCLPGYYKHDPDDLSCLECGDGYKLENGTCVSCMFGFGGFNCGNFYKLIAVVVSPAGGAVLLILLVALIVTCCRKDKNDINKIIFKSGDLQMSPYADFPKSNRISMEWGRETIEMQENGSTKNLLQMTDIYYSPALRNSDLERNGLYPFTGLPGSRHSCIYPAQWNPSFISDDSRRRDYF